MIEIDKTYKTKLSTGESFLVKRIEKNKVFGIYEKSPHLGLCSLEMGRLIDPTIKKEINFIIVKHRGVEIKIKNIKIFDLVNSYLEKSFNNEK